MSALSKEEYLKRYLSGPPAEDATKKKKKKKVPGAPPKKATVRIFMDDDNPPPAHEGRNPDDPLGAGDEEEAPVVAELIDDRPIRGHSPSRWKKIADSPEPPRRSPPRTRHDLPDLSPPANRNTRHDSPDLSPPRSRQRHDSPDLSPPRARGTRHDSPDLSPPRARGTSARHDSPDLYPPRARGTRHDSPDLSPPRARGTSARHDSPDLSLLRARGTRRDSPDLSPPRARGTRHDSPDLSPPRARNGRHDSPDMSPPRRGGRHDSPDLSPPRKGRSDSPDMSPPRKRARAGSEDLSPPRRKPGAGEDLSPPRRPQSRDLSPPRRPNVMADGQRAGLVSAAQVTEEMRKKKAAQEAKFQSMDAGQLGKGAETVVRDKQTGKRVDMKLERLKQKEEEAKKMEEEERAYRWGKGAAQERAKQEKMEEDLREIAKPFARGRDDEDLDRYLRDQDRAGDPMAHLVKKKNKSKRPVYKGAYPPNRFGIPPGYRWDGVDRSNGWEKKLFEDKAKRGAAANEAYAWSIEDM